MHFELALILPDGWTSLSPIKPAASDPTAELLDDDPNQPLFLAKAAAVFSANGVRVRLLGFFKDPLPVSTDVGLVYLLEALPGLVRFLAAPSRTPYTLGVWEQGIETQFSFSAKEPGDIVEIACSSMLNRALDNTPENALRSRLATQVLQFVQNYHEATNRYVPQSLDEPWNQTLFADACTLAKTIPAASRGE